MNRKDSLKSYLTCVDMRRGEPKVSVTVRIARGATNAMCTVVSDDQMPFRSEL